MKRNRTGLPAAAPAAVALPRRGRSRQVLLSLAALGAAASIAGLGTFATFTDSATANQTLASGTVDINLDPTGITNTLTVGATNLAPGDTVQRAVKLTNAGSLNLASVKLTTTASPSSLLDTDTTQGLQMVVESCSVAWAEVGNTFTCAGTTSTLVNSSPVIQTDTNLTGLSSLTAGNSDNLRVTMTLPSTAGNTLQGLTSTITYSFNATQRAGTSK